ncbi:glycosyltransferase [Xenorhabdus bovienii]|uniref:glycosyltransferase n=1 Tax=Xenorhabdus bovienii TaxID=40576 RepID=UPI0023B27AF4|nr:glycosyltransferase [Xenorhabdus bovienii]MDE9486656.1 glycosyltransferase [Xenorhabdus bovienii]
MNPKLSVIMAINNHTPYLEEAINSILRQTFHEFEFIIVANGCDDNLYKLLLEYQKKDERISVNRTELGGFAFALNYGLNLSKTKYIARMDADDKCSYDRLKIQFDIMEKDETISILGTACNFIDENNNYIENRNFNICTDNKKIRAILPYRNPIIHASMMCRRDCLLEIGGYRYGHMSEDHELFIRLARNKDIIFKNINIPLYSYRRHKEQITDMSRAKKNFAEISAFLLTEFILSFNFKYVIGMIRNAPCIRNFYNLIKMRKK